jgi:N-acetylglutamate synthase-like GNAT family acetyltransferase
MTEMWRRDNYLISTDKQLLDLQAIYSMLQGSYWAAERPMSITQRAIERSLVFGMYDGDRQIGFARVITDYTTFAYLADVIIDNAYRGQGLGKWLIATITGHPELCSLRRWMLITLDAQDLYQQFGFSVVDHPERHMQRIVESVPERGDAAHDPEWRSNER